MNKQKDFPTERTGDYLETLLLVIQDKQFAQAKDISEILGVTPSSVTEMFKKLSTMGYLNYQRYTGVTLTEEGERIANTLLKKHQVLKDFLVIIGVSEKTAKRDAFEIKHKASKETLSRLENFIEFLQKSKLSGGWIDHLYYYFETGKFVECQPGNKHNCPVHSVEKKK